jgi:hypothetical protein
MGKTLTGNEVEEEEVTDELSDPLAAGLDT